MSKNNTGMIIGIAAALGIGGWLLSRSLAGKEILPDSLDWLPGGVPGNEGDEGGFALTVPSNGDGGDGTTFTLPPEEAAKLKVTYPASYWYKEQNVGEVTGMSESDYADLFKGFWGASPEKMQTAWPTLTGAENYALGLSSSPLIGDLRAAIQKQHVALGASYVTESIPGGYHTFLQPPADFLGTSTDWSQRMRDEGLMPVIADGEIVIPAALKGGSSGGNKKAAERVFYGGITTSTYAGKGIPGGG